MGQPIGNGSVSLPSFLGPLIREIVPVTINDWRKLQPGMKEVLWKAIRARYKVDKQWQKHQIFKNMGAIWRASKSRLLYQVKKAKNEDERLKLKPDNIKSVAKWKAFVREKTSAAFQERSQKYQNMRKKLLPHTTSRKG